MLPGEENDIYIYIMALPTPVSGARDALRLRTNEPSRGEVTPQTQFKKVAAAAVATMAALSLSSAPGGDATASSTTSTGDVGRGKSGTERTGGGVRGSRKRAPKDSEREGGAPPGG